MAWYGLDDGLLGELKSTAISRGRGSLRPKGSLLVCVGGVQEAVRKGTIQGCYCGLGAGGRGP